MRRPALEHLLVAGLDLRRTVLGILVDDEVLGFLELTGGKAAGAIRPSFMLCGSTRKATSAAVGTTAITAA